MTTHPSAPADVLVEALGHANRAQRAGMSAKDIDNILLHEHGMTYKAVAAAVKAMPLERSDNWTQGELRKAFIKAQAYGLTGGWSDELEGLLGKLKGTKYATARAIALKEQAKFEKDFPWIARLAKGTGLAAGALSGGLAAKGAISLAAGRGLQVSGAMQPALGALESGLAGAGVGANAGAGGMLGEDSGMDRLPNAAAGAVMGGLPGAATRIPLPALSKLAKVGGLLGAGAVGKKLFDMFVH